MVEIEKEWFCVVVRSLFFAAKKIEEGNVTLFANTRGVKANVNSDMVPGKQIQVNKKEKDNAKAKVKVFYDYFEQKMRDDYTHRIKVPAGAAAQVTLSLKEYKKGDDLTNWEERLIEWSETLCKLISEKEMKKQMRDVADLKKDQTFVQLVEAVADAAQENDQTVDKFGITAFQRVLGSKSFLNQTHDFKYQNLKTFLQYGKELEDKLQQEEQQRMSKPQGIVIRTSDFPSYTPAYPANPFVYNEGSEHLPSFQMMSERVQESDLISEENKQKIIKHVTKCQNHLQNVVIAQLQQELQLELSDDIIRVIVTVFVQDMREKLKGNLQRLEISDHEMSAAEDIIDEQLNVLKREAAKVDLRNYLWLQNACEAWSVASIEFYIASELKIAQRKDHDRVKVRLNEESNGWINSVSKGECDAQIAKNCFKNSVDQAKLPKERKRQVIQEFNREIDAISTARRVATHTPLTPPAPRLDLAQAQGGPGARLPYLRCPSYSSTPPSAPPEYQTVNPNPNGQPGTFVIGIVNPGQFNDADFENWLQRNSNFFNNLPS